jgi:hypothetical protein
MKYNYIYIHIYVCKKVNDKIKKKEMKGLFSKPVYDMNRGTRRGG